MAATIQNDVTIIGGGIAGLWLLNILRQSGYHCHLIEKEALGAGQTLASQGMIHGGVKYTLAGATNEASEQIRDMPVRWQACLDGSGSIDLSQVRTLSEDYYLFSDARLSSRLTAFFGSKAIQGRVEAVNKRELPEVFRDELFKGLVYQLQDIVVDTVSLIEQLVEPVKDSILHGNPTIEMSEGNIQAVKLGDQHYSSQVTIFSAGAGNEALIEAANLPIETQNRPLKQVMVFGKDLPRLFAHAVTLKTADKPRVTITTHEAGSGDRVWYLGGQLAETGVDRTDGAQVQFARKELDLLFPWIDFSSCDFMTLDIDRSEPKNSEGSRPDTPYAKRIGNTIVCWPTKLTLAPMLGDMVLPLIPETPRGQQQSKTGHNFRIARSPWDQS